MNTEQLIAKKVKHHFDQKLKQVLFDVNSLEDHYDGLLIHASDVIYLEEGELVNGYVKVGDVNMDDAVSKEFVEEDSTLTNVLIEKHAANFSWKDGIVDSEAVLKIEVNAETLELNPEFVEAGIKVGETITVDAVEKIEEIIPAKVAKKKNNKKQ